MVDIHEILNIEIAKETMLEINPEVSDSDVERIYSKCEGNPWNAGILYELMLTSGKMTK